MIDPASIENLKNQLDVVDVVGNYIELKRTGGNYKAVCPFHDEKTPSFVVSSSKQIYHCFGCGAGGDAIKFVMEYEKLSYPEAIEKLAREYNFTLRYTKGSNTTSQKDKRILELLQKWFYKNLSGEHVEYLKKRGISEASIEKFGIGYAPSNQQVLNFLNQNFLPLPAAKEVGVVATNESGGFYARFIERITFPIYSANDLLVGFGGRTITNHPAKYINSPQTKLFNKSRVLYGYNIAKHNVYQKKQLIVTEGYIDVIMLHQAGFNTAVATLGTALTKEHLPLLKKGEPEIILAYDGDSAGVEAALKAAKLLSASGFYGGVVLFPEGKDPADMIAQGQSGEVSDMLHKAAPLYEFVIDTTVGAYDLSHPKAKEDAFFAVQSYLNTLGEIVRDSFLPYAANALGISASLFKKGRSAAPEAVRSPHSKSDIAEQSIIKTILENKNYLDMVADVCSPAMFSTHKDALKELYAENFDSPLLMGIALNETVAVMEYEELKSTLAKVILLRYYNSLLAKLPRMEMEFERKSRLMRKIKTEVLPRLRSGELVSFDAMKN